ncbi:short chain dehydrogenase, partial [Lasiosphaeria ovina]
LVGANRGIGLNLVKEFVKRGWTAHGTIRPQTRDDPSVQELRDTGAKVLELDYIDEPTIAKAADEYGDQPLDCLINCAGNPHPFAWDGDDEARLLEMFNVMTVGPYLATKYFLPKLQKGSNPIVANISSDFGCITSNERGGFLGYRMAKAALNQQTKTISQSFKSTEPKVIFLALEPGYLATKLTGWKGEDNMETSVRGMVDIVERAGISDTGRFYSYTGQELRY